MRQLIWRTFRFAPAIALQDILWARLQYPCRDLKEIFIFTVLRAECRLLANTVGDKTKPVIRMAM